MWLRVLAIASLLAVFGCGGNKTPAAESPETPAAGISELDRRKAAGCEVVGKRLTECAVSDAKGRLSEAELAELKLDETAPAHTRAFIGECVGQTLSSRQVRVYEVCGAEAPSCDELLRCLDNVKNPTTTP